LSEFGKRGIQVVAVSVDPVEVSRALAAKAGLTFPLLADPGMKAIGPYDLLHIRGHKGSDIARPAEFLIDHTGRVRWVNLTDDVRVRTTGEQVIREADRLGWGAEP
jgi:peroxiredoxin